MPGPELGTMCVKQKRIGVKPRGTGMLVKGRIGHSPDEARVEQSGLMWVTNEDEQKRKSTQPAEGSKRKRREKKTQQQDKTRQDEKWNQVD